MRPYCKTESVAYFIADARDGEIACNHRSAVSRDRCGLVVGVWTWLVGTVTRGYPLHAWKTLIFISQ